MTPRLPTALLAACLLPTAAWAQDDCLEQNWQAFVDDAPLVMAFGPWLGPQRQLAGRYHLAARHEDNFLLPDTEHGGWRAVNANGETLGYATLSCGPDLTLSGVWRTADGRASFPLRAERAPAYRTLDASVIKNVRRGTRGGQPFDEIMVTVAPEARSIRLYGKSAGVNQALHQGMLDYAEQAMACKSYAWLADRTRPAVVPRYGDRLLLLADGLAVIQRQRQPACEEDVLTEAARVDIVDPRTGSRDDMLDWLAVPDTVIASKLEVQTEPAVYDGTLSAQVWRAYRHTDPLCAAQVGFTLDARTLYPTAAGLAWLPRARSDAQACVAPAVLPWDALGPFLSPLGKQRVRAILAASAD